MKIRSISKQSKINRRGDRRGIPVASRANLLKGRGGRPNGSRNWTTLLEMACISDDDDVARIKVLYRIAKDADHSGCLRANEILNDRTFGKPAHTVEGDADRPLGFILNATIPGTGNDGKRV